MSFAESDKEFDIREYNVDETGVRLDPEAPVRDNFRRRDRERTRTRSRNRASGEADEGKEKRYNWAFFLAFIMFGLAITATIQAPGPLFAGIGIGFLFFVDPIYDAAMDLLRPRDRS